MCFSKIFYEDFQNFSHKALEGEGGAAGDRYSSFPGGQDSCSHCSGVASKKQIPCFASFFLFFKNLMKTSLLNAGDRYQNASHFDAPVASVLQINATIHLVVNGAFTFPTPL